MNTLLDDPMVQAGVAPFAVALLVAAVLSRLGGRSLATLPWLALAAALATTLTLSTGINFTPLTASRKVLLLVLLAPFAGLALDLAGQRWHALPALLTALAALSVAWVFFSVLSQAEGAQGWITGGGVALFVAALAALVLRLRDDGVATGAATLGLGAAVGVSAILSASLGTLMNGLAVGMGGAALLLLQLLAGRPIVAGYAGALTTALAAALFAAGTFLLAELRWPVLVALLAVPVVAGLQLAPERAPRVQLVLRGLATVASALLPIAAAWLLTGAPSAT